ncbi:ribonucleoside-diphosphate reductase, alpha subunit [Gloeothece citriformis PCC 7424]|uniref:Ribonucleoside-diphosphate reductase n=1 Tax=Gloeothece citriformis (strain PCC 7424) TaxID=65393 RepID=B7KJK7_GLOC7|nr:ribonucleotide reductase N-terminal alpha domain-containing protein [Gloeothece citriformis]ACK73684.1 ribonucleoside-diphosphate reductase, alpha subunit [Gloeothece citriformis PCC 7424]
MQQILPNSTRTKASQTVSQSTVSSSTGNHLSHHTSKIQVVKRDGSKAALNIAKIREVVEWACVGKDVNPIALEAGLTTRLRNGITTREIQDNLINCALEMCSPEEPDWRYVAGRLHIWSLWKDTLANRGYQYGNYDQTVKTKIDHNQYDRRILVYSSEELQEAGTWINSDWDTDYDYAGAVLLTSRYLLPDELPQEALLTCALLLASVETPENRLKWARKFYEAIAKRQISLATPILANLRVPNGSLTSCFISAIDDNLESIFSEVTNTAKISKNGGGVGINVSRIRATGSWVMNKPNASGGVIPWIKILNDTAIAVNQGGRRAGAVTISLDIWHLDVPEFLEMQTENGDQRRKAYDIFPQLVMADEFMRRVIHKQEWTLVDPYEIRTKFGVELAELWGEEFEQVYSKIETAIHNGEITLYKRVNARELFKHIMRSQLETGMPYLAFKDTINRANPNKHEGYIPGVNLCVAGETKILTDRGQIPIADLVGEKVNIWNGSEWSEVLIKKTGENQPLLKVHFSNGEYLECTYYHHFWVQDSYRSQPRLVQAKDLNPEDKLIKYRLPLIESDNDIDFPYAYTSGFFSGDGTYDGLGKPEIDLYGVKKDLLPLLTIRNKYYGGGSSDRGTQWRIEREEIGIYSDIKQDRLICKLPLDIPAKFTVPLNGYTIKSRLEWLAGLLDADGTVSRHGSNESLQIASVNRQFLLDIRLMLQTLGVDSKVTSMNEMGYQLLPDGKGGYKEYLCQSKYRLLISSIGLFQLGQLGLKTHRLQWTLREPQREASQFIKVVEVELTCRRDDTYCFNEPLRHLGMFNGILTGQCTESFSNVKPGLESHCCNLVSLNLANLDNSDLEDTCKIAVRLLDNTIDLTHPPFEAAKNHNNLYRTIGVGCMGLADWLAKRRLSYEHLTDISHLFEEIGYWCTLSSMELSQERGAYACFPGSDWSQGKLIGSKPVEWFIENAHHPERWAKLAEDIQLYGIRNSHITAIAPNTSSSLVQGCTASVLPVYSRFFYDKWAKGAVPIAPPFIKESFWFYPENKTYDQNKVVKAIAVMQQWIDTGISMELLFNLNQGVYFPEDPERFLKAKDIYDTLILAWREGCKAVYYIRTVQKDNFKDSDNSCSSCAN